MSSGPCTKWDAPATLQWAPRRPHEGIHTHIAVSWLNIEFSKNHHLSEAGLQWWFGYWTKKHIIRGTYFVIICQASVTALALLCLEKKIFEMVHGLLPCIEPPYSPFGTQVKQKTRPVVQSPLSSTNWTEMGIKNNIYYFLIFELVIISSIWEHGVSVYIWCQMVYTRRLSHSSSFVRRNRLQVTLTIGPSTGNEDLWRKPKRKVQNRRTEAKGHISY